MHVKNNLIHLPANPAPWSHQPSANIRLLGQLIDVFKYLNGLTTASARGLFDNDPNDSTRNNGGKIIVKHFNTSVAQH